MEDMSQVTPPRLLLRPLPLTTLLQDHAEKTVTIDPHPHITVRSATRRHFLLVFPAAVRPRSNITGHSLRVHPPLQTRRGHAASGSKVCPTTAFPLLQLTHCPRAGWRRLAIPSPPTSPCSCSSSSSQGPPPPPLPAHAQAHLLTHPPVTRSAIPTIEYDFTHSM